MISNVVIVGRKERAKGCRMNCCHCETVVSLIHCRYGWRSTKEQGKNDYPSHTTTSIPQPLPYPMLLFSFPNLNLPPIYLPTPSPLIPPYLPIMFHLSPPLPSPPHVSPLVVCLPPPPVHLPFSPMFTQSLPSHEFLPQVYMTTLPFIINTPTHMTA